MIKRDCQELVHMQHQSIKYQVQSHINRDYCKWENLAVFSVGWLCSLSNWSFPQESIYIGCIPNNKIYISLTFAVQIQCYFPLLVFSCQVLDSFLISIPGSSQQAVTGTKWTVLFITAFWGTLKMIVIWHLGVIHFFKLSNRLTFEHC